MEDIHTMVRETLKLSPQITFIQKKKKPLFLPAQMWDVHMWIKAEERMEMKKKACFLLGWSLFFPELPLLAINTLTNNKVQTLPLGHAILTLSEETTKGMFT